jgi:TrmH family RNA methyltransferase
MNAKTVTSLSNNTVKAVRALHMRKEREESGLFLAEGLKIVIEAIDCGHAPKIIMYGRDAADHPMLQKASQACLKAGGEVIEVNRRSSKRSRVATTRRPWSAVFKQVYTPCRPSSPRARRAGWRCRPYAIRATSAPSSAPPTRPAAAG